MRAIFFENFAVGTDNRAVNLNPTFWSSPNPALVRFNGDGVTPGAPSPGLTLLKNGVFTLSNFTNPLNFASGFGVGVDTKIEIEFDTAPYPLSGTFFASPLLTLTTDTGTITVNTAKTIYTGPPDYLPVDSFGIAVSSAAGVITYDLKSITGAPWGFVPFGNNGAPVIAYGPGWDGWYAGMYLELFFSSSGAVVAQLSAWNTTRELIPTADSATGVPPFSALSSVSLKGRSQDEKWFYTYGPTSGRPNYFKRFYLTAGNSAGEALLGPKTRIYRLRAASAVSSNWQLNGFAYQGYYYGGVNQIASDDGDTSYAASFTPNDVGLYRINDLPQDAPANVLGVKVVNVARKAGVIPTALCNVAAVDENSLPQEITQPQLLNRSYSVVEDFFPVHPITEQNWTVESLNNLVVGIKNKPVTPQ